MSHNSNIYEKYTQRYHMSHNSNIYENLAKKFVLDCGAGDISARSLRVETDFDDGMAPFTGDLKLFAMPLSLRLPGRTGTMEGDKS